MKLSPLDVRKQEFSRGMRGYDVDEVRAFLSTVAGQMDDLIVEQERTVGQLDDHKGKMGHLEDVQEALQATLNMARNNAEEARSAAMQKAELIVHEAHLKGEEIFLKAERELQKLRADITHLEVKRDQMVAKLRSVLGAEMEMLDSFVTEPANKQRDSDVEVAVAGLAYADPAARAHREELRAKAAAVSTQQGASVPDAGQNSSGSVESGSVKESKPEESAPEEVQDISEVVAALKAEVDGLPPERGQHEEEAEQLGEMQKIRQILDDLE